MPTNPDFRAKLEAHLERQRSGVRSVGPEDALIPGGVDPGDIAIGDQPSPNARAASEAQLPPLSRTTRTGEGGSGPLPVGTPATAREMLDKRRQRHEQFDPNISDPISDESKRMIGNVAAGVAAGAVTGGAGLPIRMAGQFVVPGATEYIMRRRQGESHEDALRAGLEIGGVDAALESVGGVPGRVAGAVFKRGKELVREGRNAFRAKTGNPLLDEKQGIDSLKAPFAKDLEPGAEEIIHETNRLAAREGISAGHTPGQLVDNTTLDNLENVIDASFGGSARLNATRKVALRLNRQSLDEVADSLPTPTAEELQAMLAEIGEDRVREVTGLAGAMFETIDERLGEAAVDIGPFAAELKAKILKSSGGIIPEQYAKIKLILDKGDKISWRDAQEIKSDLFSISKQFEGDAVKTKEKGLAKWAAKGLGRSMNAAMADLAPDLLPVAREANRLWGQEVRGELTNKYIKSIVDKSPESVAVALVKSANPSFVRMVRNVVIKQDPKAWESVQGSYLQQLMWDSIDAGMSGNLAERGQWVISGKKLLELMRDRASPSDPTMRAMFPGKDQKIFNGFALNARGMAAAQREAGGKGRGTVWFNMMQATGTATLLFGIGRSIHEQDLKTGEIGTGAAFVIGPHILGRLMASPTGRRWLTIGLSNPPGSIKGRRGAFALLAYMLRENLIEEEEKPKAVELLKDARKDGRGRSSDVGPLPSQRREAGNTAL